MQVYLGEKYVNNPTLSDVTFLVEGAKLLSHVLLVLFMHVTYSFLFYCFSTVSFLFLPIFTQVYILIFIF